MAKGPANGALQNRQGGAAPRLEGSIPSPRRSCGGSGTLEGARVRSARAAHGRSIVPVHHVGAGVWCNRRGRSARSEGWCWILILWRSCMAVWRLGWRLGTPTAGRRLRARGGRRCRPMGVRCGCASMRRLGLRRARISRRTGRSRLGSTRRRSLARCRSRGLLRRCVRQYPRSSSVLSTTSWRSARGRARRGFGELVAADLGAAGFRVGDVVDR